MNVQFPGVELQYSIDGETWMTYSDQDRPMVAGEVFIRSVSATGDKASRVTRVK